MKINWPAISQSVIVALLLAVGGAVWQTYVAAQRIPLLEADIARLQTKVDDLRQRSDAADERATDQINDIKVTLGVIEGRTNAEAARFGKRYAPAALEGR